MSARLLAAAKVYAFNYCQDEAEDEEDCVCGAKQHAEAKELFAAIKEAEAAPLPAEQPSNPVPRMGGNTISTWQERRSEWFRRNAQKREGPEHNDVFMAAEIVDLRIELARIVGEAS